MIFVLLSTIFSSGILISVPFDPIMVTLDTGASISLADGCHVNGFVDKLDIAISTNMSFREVEESWLRHQHYERFVLSCGRFDAFEHSSTSGAQQGSWARRITAGEKQRMPGRRLKRQKIVLHI